MYVCSLYVIYIYIHIYIMLLDYFYQEEKCFFFKVSHFSKIFYLIYSQYFILSKNKTLKKQNEYIRPNLETSEVNMQQNGWVNKPNYSFAKNLLLNGMYILVTSEAIFDTINFVFHPPNFPQTNQILKI